MRNMGPASVLFSRRIKDELAREEGCATYLLMSLTLVVTEGTRSCSYLHCLYTYPYNRIRRRYCHDGADRVIRHGDLSFLARYRKMLLSRR